jgi:signal transduction histidine kinase
MPGDLNHEQERLVLDLLAKITYISNLDDLLNVVVEELPLVVKARGCWIYLNPDYVSSYQQVVVRGQIEIHEDDLTTDTSEMIVLAATNQEKKKDLIGKAYYSLGEGIVGWAFHNCRPLRIVNVKDPTELQAISSELHWADFYNDGDEFYSGDEKRPLLVVPLVLNDLPIGVMKFHATINRKPFSEFSEEIAQIVAQIISGVIRQIWLANKRGETISRFIQVSNTQDPKSVILEVTQSMRDVLTCARSEYFCRDQMGYKAQLLVQNNRLIPAEEKPIAYKSGDSLVGWVFKTGRPLILRDVRDYARGVKLDTGILNRISDGEDVNEDDRYLRIDDPARRYTNRLRNPVATVAVPVKTNDGEIQGVLLGYWHNPERVKPLLDRSQLKLAESFASTIALALENDRRRILGDLMVKLGFLTEPQQLFDAVTETIPRLVTSSGCSIFQMTRAQGSKQLVLVNSSRKGLVNELGECLPVVYGLGQGKTGFCAWTQATLVVNHYGQGDVSAKKMSAELTRIKSHFAYDFVQEIKDENKQPIGLIQVRRVPPMTWPVRLRFRELLDTLVFQADGLPTHTLKQYAPGKIDPTWSFLAVPICHEDRLLGVITLARPIPQMPFTADQISLVESIAGRLAAVMGNIQLQEQRQNLLISLAHEINTPLTGVLADTENLCVELKNAPELQKISRHNLEQVLRLHLLTATTMTVLSERLPSRKFSAHSIFRPVKEACELFSSEAAHKGCDIVGPRALDTGFPTIEMSVFDLTIAFKNIVHNAVKYSFRPPQNLEKHRYIKIWGHWDKKTPNLYCINVQNYGVGITKDEIEKRLIFEPFYRGEKAGDRHRTGSGFGLAHARQVIEDMHHGFIHVTSIPQGGDAYLTTFTVAIPIRQPNTSLPSQENTDG